MEEKADEQCKSFMNLRARATQKESRLDVILNETVNQRASSLARILYRRIRQLHVEALNHQSADPVERRLSTQMVSLAGLVLLVLGADDPTLMSLARSWE